MEARWGKPVNSLLAGHPAWDLEADYLALGIVNWTCTLSPERIILGGGILRHRELLGMAREKVAALLSGYLDTPEIVPPHLGARAGVLGAMALADTKVIS